MQLSWNYRLMFFVRELSFEEILCGLNEAFSCMIQSLACLRRYQYKITNISYRRIPYSS